MQIGNFTLSSDVLLAPIAGYSDVGMRILCSRYGAGLCYTEMVSAKGLCYKNENTADLLYTEGESKPLAVQLFGGEPQFLAKAIASDELQKFDIIDINMGCPVPKIFKNGEGSALLAYPERAYEIVMQAKQASRGRAVTVKLRAGLIKDNYLAIDVAQATENAGVDAITIHGRTRDMYYSGRADLGIIKSVKSSVGVPVIGNGDIVDCDSYLNMKEYCGVDGVMVARGAIGKPYIFSEILGIPYVYDLKATILEHIALISYLPERVVCNNMKKHIAYYVKGLKNAKLVKERIYSSTSVEEHISILNELL